MKPAPASSLPEDDVNYAASFAAAYKRLVQRDLSL